MREIVVTDELERGVSKAGFRAASALTSIFAWRECGKEADRSDTR
jgi:hypothetical protein